MVDNYSYVKCCRQALAPVEVDMCTITVEEHWHAGTSAVHVSTCTVYCSPRHDHGALNHICYRILQATSAIPLSSCHSFVFLRFNEDINESMHF